MEGVVSGKSEFMNESLDCGNSRGQRKVLVGARPGERKHRTIVKDRKKAGGWKLPGKMNI